MFKSDANLTALNYLPQCRLHNILHHIATTQINYRAVDSIAGCA